MKISIGFDHGAFLLRPPLLEHLQEEGHQVIDHGTRTRDSVDYPDYAQLVCEDVSSGRSEIGILACTTGIGMSISANKVQGIRAALVHFEDEAALSRQHNNANVICLGGLHTTVHEALRFVDIFIASSFEGGRHARRVGKISRLENDSSL